MSYNLAALRARGQLLFGPTALAAAPVSVGPYTPYNYNANVGAAAANAENAAPAPNVVRVIPLAVREFIDSNINEVCGICLETLRMPDMSMNIQGMPITVCGNKHRFHEKCLNTWIEINPEAKCPTCRELIIARGGYKKRNRKTRRKRNTRKTNKKRK